jgi:polysaccharide biosynthesis protein PelC
MSKNMKIACPLWLALAFLIAGCGSNVSVKPFADPSMASIIEGGIAVLPFDNLSESRSAGKTMENMLLIELLKQSSVRFVNPGEVSQALQDERIRLATSMSREALRNLGARLEVSSVVQGVVQEYSMQRLTASGGSGEVPVVSVTIRMLDVETGAIIWAASSTRRGNDTEKVFGIGRVDSLEMLAQNVAAEIAESYAKSVRSSKSKNRKPRSGS